MSKIDLSGGYTIPTTDGWRQETQGVILEGDSQVESDGMVRYYSPPGAPRATGDSHGIVVATPSLTLRDLCISNGQGLSPGVGCGILHDEVSTLWGLLLDHVGVLYAGRNCLRLTPQWIDADHASYNVSPRIRDCNFYGASSDGVVMDTVTDLLWEGSGSTMHKGRGLVLTRSAGFKIRGGGFENVDGSILLKDCGPGEVGGWFEQFCDGGTRGWLPPGVEPPATLKEPAIILDNCRGVTVRTSVFEDWTGKKPTSILLRNGTTGCVIEKSSHVGVGLSVDDGGCRGNTIFRQTSPAGWPAVPWKVNRERNTVIG